MDCSTPGSLSITNYQSLFKLMSIVMPSNHLILCCPLPLPPSNFPSIRVFSNESVLCTRWPKYWSLSFNISPFDEYSGLFPLGWTGWISSQCKGLARVFSNTTVQKHQFFGTTRDQTLVPCIGRWILNHWTTREVPFSFFNNLYHIFPGMVSHHMR